MLNKIQSIDWDILLFLNRTIISRKDFLNKFLAEYLIYFIPLFLISLWFFSRKEKTKIAALRSVFAAILAWPILAQIIGIIVNRPRPFVTGDIHELVFHRPTYSFPSDHAAALFAITFSFWFSGYKKIAWFLLGLSVVICVFRVATGIHYPTDIFVGAIFGLLAAYIIKILDPILNKAYEFLLKIAGILRLA